MTARTRTRNFTYTGRKVNRGGIYTLTKGVYNESCTDVVGNYGKQNPLILLKTEIYGGRLNGQASGILGSTFEDYPSDSYGTDQLLGFYGNADNYKTQALARTGLSTPVTNLPLFILELKDIPKMLKHAGDLLHHLRHPSGLSLHKEAAAATLAYQFGWAPLIQDLRKLIRFQDSVEKRRRQIDAAFNNGTGYTGRATLRLDESETSSTGLLQTSGEVFIYGRTKTVTFYKIWCSVPWTPRARFRQLGYDAAQAAAFRSALGLNARNIPLTVWKLLPWTWLSDWFINCSDSISAINNLIDYRPNTGCIMVNRKVTTEKDDGFNNGVYLSRYKRVQELKQRFVITSWGSGAPTLRLPFMDNFKLSVLGSLAILKIAR